MSEVFPESPLSSPPATTPDPPVSSAYARWCRMGPAHLSDTQIAEGWHYKTPAEWEFWTALDTPRELAAALAETRARYEAALERIHNECTTIVAARKIAREALEGGHG